LITIETVLVYCIDKWIQQSGGVFVDICVKKNKSYR